MTLGIVSSFSGIVSMKAFIVAGDEAAFFDRQS
jgi:hypothetical protein